MMPAGILVTGVMCVYEMYGTWICMICAHEVMQPIASTCVRRAAVRFTAGAEPKNACVLYADRCSR